jgi:predicted metalloendopeptidase
MRVCHLLLAAVVSLPAMLAAQDATAYAARPIQLADPANFDTTCAPCTDFWQYVNGAWDRRAVIPARYSTAGLDREVIDRNEALLHRILDNATRPGADTSDAATRLIGTFYGTCMDSVRAARDGARPLDSLFRRIASVSDRAALPGFLGGLLRQGIDAGVPFYPFPDMAHSDTLRLNSYQGSYGLPDRDYYLRGDSNFVVARRHYDAHLVRMFRLIGDGAAQARVEADRVWRLELALATAALPSEQATKFPLLHHPVRRDRLDSMTPHLAWTGYLDALGVPGVSQINVMIPAELHALDSLLAAAPLPDWRSYLRWRVAHYAAPYLSPAFEREHLAYRRIVAGETELKPRWQRCMLATDQKMGEALGQAYVREAFTPEAKRRMLEMVADLRTVLATRLGRLTWMSEPTQREAERKLDAMKSKIGYPDTWRDYSALHLARGAFLANMLAAERFEVDRQLRRVDGLVDRTEWSMTPATDNAYFNTSNDEIVFPAGILQPPYFDVTSDDAANYGAIGAIIGHEMLHAFDDDGRHFDSRGNLSDWWTPADSAAFERRADVVVAQYGSYVGVDTMHLNGRLTLGENLADIGGLRVAYEAWQLARGRHPDTAVVDGVTPEQRFFIGYAASWRNKYRPEVLRNYLVSNPHSPDHWRVVGALSQMEEFARAFRCGPGDAMVQPPERRLDLW